MIRLATVIDTFEADFLAQYRNRLTSDHHRALAAMKQCRTQASPMMQVRCTGCDHQKMVPHSCGHRHCPHCQHHESQQWLERQLKKQVPAEYFLLTFTLPAEFRGLAWAHQSAVYGLLMRCCWETVRIFSQNDKQLQGTPGAIAVLHTHTRRLEYHPHVHLVMPAAAVDGERRQWRTKRRQAKGGYLFNHKALAKVFRGKMLAGIEAAGLALPRRHPEKWVVDCKSVGSGEPALVYLGRYLYRGVIAEKDIVACDNAQVSFRYRNARTGRMERRTVSGAHFLWLVLQHVLPKGFRRARNFGFLHPNCKRLIALLHLLLRFAPNPVLAWVKERAPILCACCGAVMVIVKTRIRTLFAGPAPALLAAGGTL
ncbi:IS91 family transposase [Denitratisoma oestradiolicum]|uniref:Transposase n=1 Tax=Denitratisoma oestradiolicum TaxID=311182 RepID=A0A6S6XYB8_9PROT|nr:transposase [Denitratisoma oestradiolicum]TWO82209.1 IS91 family transposase [Denitratisoma oestradiolicum]CAB1369149.1 transposase [Denitratisoma oestradiolicum]